MKTLKLSKLLFLFLAIGLLTSCNDDEETTINEPLESNLTDEFNGVIQSQISSNGAYSTAFNEAVDENSGLNDYQIGSCNVIHMTMIARFYDQNGGIVNDAGEEIDYIVGALGWDAEEIPAQADFTWGQLIEYAIDSGIEQLANSGFTVDPENALLQILEINLFRDVDGTTYVAKISYEQALDFYDDCMSDDIEWVELEDAVNLPPVEPEDPIEFPEDPSCVSMIYPISILVTDSSSDFTESYTIEVSNNEELYNALIGENGPGSVILLDFVYPVSVNANGTVVTANNLEELENIYINTECDE